MSKAARRLSVRVTPNASRSRVEEQPDGSLRVWVQAPPEGGRANKAVCEAVAKWADAPKRGVTLVSGEKSRDKILDISA